MMRKVIILFVLFIQMKTCLYAQSDFHLIYFKDIAPNLNQYTSNTLAYLKDIFGNIATSLEMEFKVHEFDENTSKKELSDKIISTIKADNIVIVVLLGKGIRDKDDKAPFPKIKFKGSDYVSQIPLTEIHDTLKSKNPRLLVTIGDISNQISSESNVIKNLNKTLSSYMTYPESCATMFGEAKGDLLICAASPNEPTLYAKNSNIGSIFMTNFVEHLRQSISFSETKESTYDMWKSFIDKVKAGTHDDGKLINKKLNPISQGNINNSAIKLNDINLKLLPKMTPEIEGQLDKATKDAIEIIKNSD